MAANSQSSMSPMGGASQKPSSATSPSPAMDQYTRDSQPSVTERIAHGSTAEQREQRTAATQKKVEEWGKVLGDKTPVVPVEDKMTEEWRKL